MFEKYHNAAVCVHQPLTPEISQRDYVIQPSVDGGNPATLGGELKIEINSEGVESNRGGGDATALRLMIYLDDDPG